MTMGLDEDVTNCITGPNGSVRGHRNRVIRSIQKIGFLSSSGNSSSCSTSTSSSSSSSSSTSSSSSSSSSDTDSEASSSSFYDLGLSLTTSCSITGDSGASLFFEAEDTDVIRSLRGKWSKRRNNATGRSDEEKDGDEEDEVVLYTTSIGVIRSTFESSNKIRYENYSFVATALLYNYSPSIPSLHPYIPRLSILLLHGIDS